MGVAKRWNWSIRNRILVPYLGLIVVVVGGTGLACAQWAADRARDQFLDRGRGIAETMLRSNFPLTEPVLAQLKGLGGAEFALLDPGGRIQSSTLGDVQGSALPEWFGPGSDLSFGRTWSFRGVEYRAAVVDRGPGPGLGAGSRLLILLPEPTLRAAAWEARRPLLVLSLLAAGGASLLASWVGRNLSRPLSEIHAAIRRIGTGNFEAVDLPAGRTDEIGELAEGVTRMAGWLRTFRDEQVQTERLRLIRQVSAGLAHELRNPLTAARMTLQIFLERNRDRDIEPLRIALGELGRMERQVRRFLQIARPEPPHFEVGPLAPIVERSVAGLAATADHQGVTLRAEVEPDLPPSRVDTDQLSQALSNLILNAIEASGPGGTVVVRLGAPAEGRLSIEVVDDGPGISAEDLPRLFQPFHSTKPEGVGLGLTLVSSLIREQGGAIEHARSEGLTRFRLDLPVHSASPTHAGPARTLLAPAE